MLQYLQTKIHQNPSVKLCSFLLQEIYVAWEYLDILTQKNYAWRLDIV